MAEATEKAPAIYRAIAGVIADVGSVGKDKINKQQGFKFRSIDVWPKIKYLLFRIFWSRQGRLLRLKAELK